MTAAVKFFNSSNSSVSGLILNNKVQTLREHYGLFRTDIAIKVWTKNFISFSPYYPRLNFCFNRIRFPFTTAISN